MAAASYYGAQQSHYHQDNRLGGSAYKHGSHTEAERVYDSYRDNARHAHDTGDYNGMNHWNKQASDYIFRENNAPGRVQDNEIDLHGQFVKEAEDILELRLDELQREGQTGVLHVIVGKGNHSPGHIQKIKPAVERLCRERGLHFETEPNEGRIRVHLRLGAGGAPEPNFGAGYPGAQQQQGYQTHQQPQYGQQQGQAGKPQQQFTPQEEKMEQDAITRCIKSCCTVM